jgi:hypothetical protein
MDMSQLKALENKLHIISVIEKASLYGGDMWQSRPGEENGRSLSQIIQIQNDLKFDKVIFRTPSIFQVDPTRPIFVRLSYRNLIFRLLPGEFHVVGDRVYCHYPREARALEERKGDRYVLPINSEISLSLKRLEKSMREMTYEMELRIIDVSERGFGILISNQNRDYFRKYDHFWLKAVDHRSLHSEILGSVCYVAPRGYYLKRGDVRVGLSLQAPLPQETFESLKKKCLIVLSA